MNQPRDGIPAVVAHGSASHSGILLFLAYGLAALPYVGLELT